MVCWWGTVIIRWLPGGTQLLFRHNSPPKNSLAGTREVVLVWFGLKGGETPETWVWDSRCVSEGGVGATVLTKEGGDD